MHLENAVNGGIDLLHSSNESVPAFILVVFDVGKSFPMAAIAYPHALSVFINLKTKYPILYVKLGTRNCQPAQKESSRKNSKYSSKTYRPSHLTWNFVP